MRRLTKIQDHPFKPLLPARRLKAYAKIALNPPAKIEVMYITASLLIVQKRSSQSLGSIQIAVPFLDLMTLVPASDLEYQVQKEGGVEDKPGGYDKDQSRKETGLIDW